MEYFSVKGTKIICHLCGHSCRIAEGKVGLCGVEANVNGTLVNVTYGRPSALHIDPVEKKPLYHFLPGSKALSLGTVGCNFRCGFCQNWQISQEHTIDETIEITPMQIVEYALQEACESIAYTYNEPTVFYPYARDIGMLAKENGIKNIFVSNGFQSDEVFEDMLSWVDAINVDLKSFSDRYYKKELKGELERIKRTIARFAHSPIHTEITTLLIPGINDSDLEISSMAEFIASSCGVDTVWHLSAFHPDYKMLDREATPLATLDRALNIAKHNGLRFVYVGNIVHDTSTYCYKCDTRLIARQGFSVLSNHLEEGTCPNCHTKIAGVWS